MEFIDKLKQIGKTTLYTTYPKEIVEKFHLKKGMYIKVKAEIIEGEENTKTD